MRTWDDAAGVVEFPDGRSVRASGVLTNQYAWKVRGELPGARPAELPAPQFAVYLLGRRPAPTAWPARWVRWPDFRTPADTADALDALRDAHRRAATERVEIACGSGIGRTGTALAVLAILSGVAPAEAVAWVRAHHHRRAVETPGQRRWLRRPEVVSLYSPAQGAP